MAKIVGHTFLAKLGKKRLRPGGVKATNWLLSQVDLNNKDILEVACNMGTTSFKLAKKYNAKIIGVDKDTEALAKASLKLDQRLKGHLSFMEADALNLAFEPKRFDVVLNEAMLTMFPDANKTTAVAEYYRVLKDGGVLLTHDICFFTDDINLQNQIIADISRAINIRVSIYSVNKWKELFSNSGFNNILVKTGRTTLLKPIGMIKDEGLLNTVKIIKNAHRKENIKQFKAMRAVFKKYNKQIGFIAVASYK